MRVSIRPLLILGIVALAAGCFGENGDDCSVYAPSYPGLVLNLVDATTGLSPSGPVNVTARSGKHTEMKGTGQNYGDSLVIIVGAGYGTWQVTINASGYDVDTFTISVPQQANGDCYEPITTEQYIGLTPSK